MPGVNFAGGNTNDYVLGRGIIYFRGDIPTFTTAWRDLGNATEFTIQIESETLEHQSSLEGLKTVDLEVLLSQKMNVSFSLDEMNINNLNNFFLGTALGTNFSGTGVANGSIAATTAVSAGPASTGWTNSYQPIAGAGTGVWYDLWNYFGTVGSGGTTGAYRCYDFEDDQVTSVTTNGATATALTEGTDYEFDRRLGRIRFILGGAHVNNTEARVTWQAPDNANAGPGQEKNTTDGIDSALNRVQALTGSGVPGQLKFVQTNPVTNHTTEYWFPQVTLKPEGDFSGIGEDWTTITFTGAVEQATTPGFEQMGGFLNITERSAYAP